MNTLILIVVTLAVTAGYYNLLNWLYKMKHSSPESEALMAGLVGSVGSLVFAIALMFVYPFLHAGLALVCGICAGLAVFTGVAKFIAA